MTRGPVARMQHFSVEVSDTDRSIDFYRKVLGFKVTERHPAGEVKAIPVELTFMRLGARHHELVLVHNPKKKYTPRPTRPEEDLEGPPSFHHFALECDTREAFEEVIARVEETNTTVVRGPVVHSAYHPAGDGSWGENEAVYILDPDGHRVEIFWALAAIDADGTHVNHLGQRVPGTGVVDL